MKQIWKDIRNYVGLYQASNFGRVKSLNYKRTGKERILVPFKDGRGYLQVTLCKKGQKNKNMKIHKLVFETFYRRLLPNEECHHINHDVECNISTNLVARDAFLHNSEHKKNNKNFLGHHHSKETRQKISKAIKEYWKRRINK